MRPNNFLQSTKSRKLPSRSDEAFVEHRNTLQEICYDEYDLEDENDVLNINVKQAVKNFKFENLETAPFAFETQDDVCNWIIALVSESPLALSLLKHAENEGWGIELCALDDGEYHLDSHQKILGLNHHGFEPNALGNSEFFLNSLLYTTVKALRDIWHESRMGAIEAAYKPESIIMLERARAADVDAVSIIIGWELRGAGFSNFWRHILSTEDSDMAQVLVNILERYPTALYNGMAHAHVFRQWYASESRIDSLDHIMLEELDYLLFEKAYEFGSKTASPLDFETLSTLPDKTMYLNGLGSTVARDPFFSGLDSAINQAHLFQIIYDSKVIEVKGVPFRDNKLAQKIFPVS